MPLLLIGGPIGKFVVGLEGTELLLTGFDGNGPRVVGGDVGTGVVAADFSADPPDPLLR